MSGTPFMPLWVSDFVGDTLDLDAQEVGAYMLILMAQWTRNGRSIPAEKLPRVARCGRNWPKVWASIGHYFSEDDEGIYSRKGRDVFQNVAAKREVNSHNGALGGKAKALKSKGADLANGSETLERNPSIPKPEPDREKTEANASAKKRGSRLSPDWFLPQPWGLWAVEQGMTQDQVRREADRFRDWWIAKAGAGGVKLDWEATWRNWIRKWLDTNGKAQGNERKPAGSARLAAFMAAAEPQRVGLGPDRDPSQPLLARR